MNEEELKQALKNMIFFRNDKDLYVFWRNVYQCLRRRMQGTCGPKNVVVKE